MSNDRSLEVKNVSNLGFSEIREMAATVVKSNLFPSAKTQEGAFTLMMLCQSEGLHPMQAVRRFHIIQGQVSMKADAMLAEFQSRGGQVEWLKYTNEEVSASFHAPGLIKPVTVSWSMEDAKRAKLNDKDNYKNYPKQMLKARVVSEGVRMSMPGVVVGIYTPEEVGDIIETAAVTMPTRASEAKKLDAPPPAAPPTSPPPPATTPTPQAVEPIEATVTIGDIKKFKDGHFEVLDAEGVIYTTTDEAFAAQVKEAKGQIRVIEFQPVEGKNPVLLGFKS